MQDKIKKGFSLVELLISLGILSILGFSFYSFMSSSNKSKEKFSQDIEISQQASIVSDILNHEKSCTTALQNQAVNISSSNSLEQLNFPSAENPILSIKKEFVQGVKIESSTIEIKEMDSKEKLYLATIKVKNTRTNQEISTNPLREQVFMIPVVVDNGDHPTKIVSCSLEAITTITPTPPPAKTECPVCPICPGQCQTYVKTFKQREKDNKTVSCAPDKKVRCWGTGNGRNWSWKDTLDGCQSSEGSGNYGSPGCACECKEECNQPL